MYINELHPVYVGKDLLRQRQAGEENDPRPLKETNMNQHRGYTMV